MCVPAGLPVGPAWPGLASEPKGTSTTLLGEQRASPGTQWAAGLGSGWKRVPSPAWQLRQDQEEDGGEGQGGGQTDFLPGCGPAQLRVCGWLLDLPQMPSVTSLEGPVAVLGRGRAHGARGLARVTGWGWDPRGQQSACHEHPENRAGLGGAGRAAGRAGSSLVQAPGSTGQPGLPGLREEGESGPGALRHPHGL